MHKVTAYRTSDGCVFEDEVHACGHEAETRLMKWADETGLCRGGEWSTEMVVDAILQHSAELAFILQQHSAANPKPTVSKAF